MTVAGSSFIEVTSLSAIAHILEHRPQRVQRLYVPGGGKGRLGELVELARAARIPVDTGGGGRNAREACRAMLGPFQYTDFDAFVESTRATPRALVLALDHLQDPQNFGALCRSAEGFGASAILLPKDRSVAVSPGVYNASVGAVETIPIVLVNNLGESLRKLKGEGFWVVGTTLDEAARPPWEMPDFEKTAIVLGAELEGLSPSVEKLCDWTAFIPMPGKIQSLNVSNAGAVLLYELSRRAQTKK